MDYYEKRCHHKEIGCIKIVKYLTICTLALLLVGVITLATRLLATTIIEPSNGTIMYGTNLTFTHLILDYGIVLLVTLIALFATIKENFFFLITSATCNIILGLANFLVTPFRMSIIFLQLCSSLFIFIYTLSVYLRMKMDIRRKKKREKDMARIHIMDKENLYQNSVKSHSYDKLVLTNEWLASQQASSQSIDNNDRQQFGSSCFSIASQGMQ
ncbi:hypothetical protein RDWZM_007414 [Blomia tropicalis]|uniref:Uncharacterized protein n=1 Tax=Blomia tropicalis TaxID=40697 RepID=A0A9Q0M2K6_BLOTA|nr:hypothetical protein RDWZM_007414 [Blomia tropicalis]